MTDDDIKTIAAKCNYETSEGMHSLNLFARAIEAQVREECAKTCERVSSKAMTLVNMATADRCADAIRSMGK